MCRCSEDRSIPFAVLKMLKLREMIFRICPGRIYLFAKPCELWSFRTTRCKYISVMPYISTQFYSNAFIIISLCWTVGDKRNNPRLTLDQNPITEWVMIANDMGFVIMCTRVAYDKANIVMLKLTIYLLK